MFAPVGARINGLGLAAICLLVLGSIWLISNSPSAPHTSIEYGASTSIAKDSYHAPVDSPHAAQIPAVATVQHRDLIIYTYFETDRAKLNLEYFLRHALHASADFLFIINGMTTTVTLPTDLPNVQIVRRPNTCFDLGTYHELFAGRTDYDATQLAQYTRFLLINSSIRGPFLPSWGRHLCWSDLYLDKLSATTKLVGMSYYCQPAAIPQPGSHLQSMILATDQLGIKALTDGGLKCFEDMHSAVHEGEVKLVDSIRRAGYDVYAMMSPYEARAEDGSSAAFDAVCQQHNSGPGSPYELPTFHPYEMLFSKTDSDKYREHDQTVVAKLTELAAASNFSSFEACSAAH